MIVVTLVVAVLGALGAALQPAHAQADATASRGETTWVLPNLDGIIEALAVHPTTGESFFSDVRNRCIWSREASGGAGALKQFSADADGLLAVFALRIDAAGQTLWASSSALPEMKGYTDADRGKAFIAAYDIATRKLRRTYALPADGHEHVLGDFVLAADGSLYVSDSASPVIWRLPPGGAQLEKWLESADFKSLQGLAFSSDGRSLYIADYAKGLFRVALATRAAELMAAPVNAELRGIDGLYATPGELIAVQNGVSPQRIVRIALNETGAIAHVGVVLARHPAMIDLALGQLVNGTLHVIGNAGWELYPTPTATPPPRAVTILNIVVTGPR